MGLLVVQVSVLNFHFYINLGSTKLPEVTPNTVDEVFKLPLREPKAVFLTNALDIRLQSVDVGYQPIGRCTMQKNDSISCWTQVIEAGFILLERVSLPYLLCRE